MATAHIEAKKGDIAKVVLMPGDPLRAKFVAETFLEDVVQFNTVRNMFGFTGTYKGVKVSVMGSGMGMPSIGIYSYELYKFYDVEKIIRIGSAGSYDPDMNLYDIFICEQAWSESNYAHTQNGEESNLLDASKDLNDLLKTSAAELDIPYKTGIIHSSDVFYRHDEPKYWERLMRDHGVQAVEMESFALFHNANVLEKEAACILTMSDSLVTSEVTTPQERQESFTNMMKIALEAAIK